MQFTDYVNQTVSLLIPAIDAKILQQVKIRGVDVGGLWIESQALTNIVLSKANSHSAPKTLVFFVPYGDIKFGFVGVEGPSLNEKSFGV